MSSTLIMAGENGHLVSAIVADVCPGCGSGSIALSINAFEAVIGPIGNPNVIVTWSFVD